MYKTVRHGENSLQYTILPQTEEVLSNSGLKGKGRDYSPSIHVRRSRRKSTVKYVLLIIFGVIIALALAAVPLYVMNGALLARRSQQSHPESLTSAPLGKSRKKELKAVPDAMPTVDQKSESSTTTKKPITITTSSNNNGESATTPPWTMPALRSWKISTSSTTIPPLPTDDSDIPHKEIPMTPSSNRHPEHDTSIKPGEQDIIIIRPTVTPETLTVRNILNNYYPRLYVSSEKPITNTKVFNDALITTTTTSTRAPTQFDGSKFRNLKDDMLSADDDDELKESLEVDEVFPLPPGKPDFAITENESDEVTMSKTSESSWYGSRWPFVDTSSSIQWTVYTLGDNLLLPLLVAALSSVALVLLLALAVRRRKRSYASTAQIGKLTADLQADDNTNLLTAENPEDADE